jgi:hypothetical protein
LCHIDTLVKTLLDLVQQPPGGRRITNVADREPYDQRQLASWFAGRGVPLPVALVKPLYWSAALLPRGSGYALRCLFWKLFQPNTYVTGLRPLDAAAGGRS